MFSTSSGTALVLVQFLQQHKGTGLEIYGGKVDSVALKDPLPKNKEQPQFLSFCKPRGILHANHWGLFLCSPVPSDIIGGHETNRSPAKTRWDLSLLTLASQTRFSPDRLYYSKSPKCWSPNSISSFTLRRHIPNMHSRKADIVPHTYLLFPSVTLENAMLLLSFSSHS